MKVNRVRFLENYKFPHIISYEKLFIIGTFSQRNIQNAKQLNREITQ